MSMNQARFNMVEQQVRPWGVLDARVLDLLHKIPRESFVPTAYAGFAHADIEIPLGHGAVMLPPKLEGRMLQSLAIQPHERILEIGTGSGYFTALLASLGALVDSVELVPELSAAAREKLQSQGIQNVRLFVENAAQGWGTNLLYDVIVLTGSVWKLAPQFPAQLQEGGRLLVVEGTDPVMLATLVTKSCGLLQREVLFETSIPPLVGAEPVTEFEF